MNFNWGHGLVVFFSIFVSSLVMVVVKSRQVPINLVKSDYYVDDLALETLLEKRRNQSAIKDFSYELTADQKLSIRFGDRTNGQGVALLYRPSDEKMDHTLDFEFSDSTGVQLAVPNLQKGLWKVIIQWTDGEKDYIFEDRFVKP